MRNKSQVTPPKQSDRSGIIIKHLIKDKKLFVKDKTSKLHKVLKNWGKLRGYVYKGQKIYKGCP